MGCVEPGLDLGVRDPHRYRVDLDDAHPVESVGPEPSGLGDGGQPDGPGNGHRDQVGIRVQRALLDRGPGDDAAEGLADGA